jgi:hypothetical protein
MNGESSAMLTDLYDAYQVDSSAGALKTLPRVL